MIFREFLHKPSENLLNKVAKSSAFLKCIFIVNHSDGRTGVTFETTVGSGVHGVGTWSEANFACRSQGLVIGRTVPSDVPSDVDQWHQGRIGHWNWSDQDLGMRDTTSIDGITL